MRMERIYDWRIPAMNDSKLTRFDDETRNNHHFLNAEDDCYYFMEYTSRKPFKYSSANSFISNLKKHPKTRGTWQWKHKRLAIKTAAETLMRELPADWRSHWTFVPV